MQYADVHLPYFKQGDDLNYHLSNSGSVEEALEAHAQQLEFAAAVLRKVKEMITGRGVSIDADTHMIQVSGPDEVIDALIAADLADRDLYDDDDEEDEELIDDVDLPEEI